MSIAKESRKVLMIILAMDALITTMENEGKMCVCVNSLCVMLWNC